MTKKLSARLLLISAFTVLALVTTVSCGGGSAGSGGAAKGPYTVIFDKGNAPTPTGNQAAPADVVVDSNTNLVLPGLSKVAAGKDPLPEEVPATATLPGSCFIGWAVEKQKTNPEAYNTALKRVVGAPGELYKVTGTVTLYAVYIATAYDNSAQQTRGITLNKNLGTSTVDVVAGWPAAYTSKVAAGQKIAPYSSVEMFRPGFDFKGWALSATAADALVYAPGVAFSVGAEAPASGNFQIYAQWKASTNLVQITYDLNGGAGEPKTVDGISYSLKQAKKILSLEEINRPVLQPDAAVLTSPSVTAEWKAQSDKVFVGWTNVTPITSTSKALYQPGETLTGASTTLYAIWGNAALAKSVSFSYNEDNSTAGFNKVKAAQLTPSVIPDSSNKYLVGQSVTLLAAPVIGTPTTATPWKGSFLGWTTAATKTGTAWPAGQPFAGGYKYIIQETDPAVVAFFAQWQEADYGFITFNGNATNAGAALTGSAPDDIKAYLGTTITLPGTSWSVGASPAKQFLGWGDSPTSEAASVKLENDTYAVTDKYTAAAGTLPESGKKTFYAIWAAIHTVTLDRQNVAASGEGQYPNAPALNPGLGATATPTKKVAQGRSLNLTTGDFATFKTRVESAGYTVEWGTRTGAIWTAIPNQAAYSPSADSTIYAKFTGKPVVVTFNRNSNAISELTEVAPSAHWGEATGVVIPEVVKGWGKPTDAGYEYGGLAYELADTSATAATKLALAWIAPASASYAATKTLYVFWVGKTYHVTFAGTGTTGTQAEITGTWPAVVTLPATTTLIKDGFNFTGWALGTTAVTDLDTVTPNIQWKPAAWAESTALNSVWNARTYTVTYFLDGGTGTAPDTTTNDWPVTVTLPVTTATKDGYSFGGWIVPGDTVAKDAGTSWQPASYGTGTATVTAQWIARTYTVTYALNGGESTQPQVSTVTWPGSVTLPSPPTRNGYTFTGWQIAGGTTLASTATTWKPAVYGTEPGVKNFTLTAQWTIRQYTVSFDSNGAESGAASPATSAATPWGSSVALAAEGTMVKDGYSFFGWATTRTGTTAVTSPWTPTGTFNATQTLYAIWGTKDYSVTYNLNGGTSAQPAPSPAVWPSMVTLPANPTRPNYDFAGWKPDGAATLPPATTEWKPATYGPEATGKSFALTAQWTKQQYTVTFNPNGATSGAASPATSAVTDWSTSVELAAVGTMVKDGYTFAGWATNASGTTAVTSPWTPTGTFNPSQNLYAIWTAKSYTVNYALNSGTSAQPAQANATWPNLVTLPANPTRDGYTFAGWLPTGSTVLAPATTTWKPATYGTEASGKIFTLTAQWTGKPYTITYVLNGGTSAQPPVANLTWPTAVTLPDAPTINGYNFTGWKVSGLSAPNIASSATRWTPPAYASAITLTAQWVILTYTVTFDANGASGTPSIVTSAATNWGTAVTLASTGTMTYAGYSFMGWATTDNASTALVSPWLPTGSYNSSITLYAVWNPISITITFSLGPGATGTPPAAITVTYDQYFTLPSVQAGWSNGGKTLTYWVIRYPDNTRAVTASPGVLFCLSENGARFSTSYTVVGLWI